MKKCLICGEDKDDDDGYCICGICKRHKIKDEYNYVANKKEMEFIKELIRMEDLLA
jgi:hypothetical protein